MKAVRTIRLERDSAGALVVRLKNLRDRTEKVLPPTEASSELINHE